MTKGKQVPYDHRHPVRAARAGADNGADDYSRRNANAAQGGVAEVAENAGLTQGRWLETSIWRGFSGRYACANSSYYFCRSGLVLKTGASSQPLWEART